MQDGQRCHHDAVTRPAQWDRLGSSGCHTQPCCVGLGQRKDHSEDPGEGGVNVGTQG